MSRRAAREAALRALFAMDMGGDRLEPEDLRPDDYRFFDELVAGASARRGELDSLIEGHAEGWPLHRMAVVDRNLLRLALYELTAEPKTPAAVVINEAVELAKAYGTAESGKFINGILGRIAREGGGP